MDKTTGFALLGFLFIVLAASLAPRSGGGASPLPGVSAAGGGGGGGGGGVCSMMVDRFRMCALQEMDEIPAAFRDRAMAEFENQMSSMQAECSAEAAAAPDKAQAMGACLAMTDCDAIGDCIRAIERR